MNSKLTSLVVALLIVALSAMARPATAAPALSGGDPGPAPTPVPQAGTMLIGHVVWEGRPAQPDTLQELPITIDLTQLDTNPSYEAEYAATTDKNGTFVIDIGQVPIGQYEWRAKGAQFLSNSGKVTLGLSNVTDVKMGLMRAGDVVDDNVVNARDFNAFTGSFNKVPKDPGYLPAADLTGDGVVNISDFRLLAEHFGQTGD